LGNKTEDEIKGPEILTDVAANYWMGPLLELNGFILSVSNRGSTSQCQTEGSLIGHCPDELQVAGLSS